MTEINYLERPKPNDPYHNVMGAFEGWLQPGKKPVEIANKRGQQVSAAKDDARDDAANIIAADSGEDLAFDPTKVFTPEMVKDQDREEADDEVRDNKTNSWSYKPPSTPRYSNYTKHESSYNGRSWQVNANSAAYNRKPDAVASQWQPKTYTQDSSDDKPKTNLLSPKRYSLSKINNARNGPAPKSDDFYAELKKWHSDHALRQVEKPREIMVVKNEIKQGDDTSSASIDSTDKKKAKKRISKREKKQAKKKMDPEAKVASEDAEMAKKETSEKKKKKFWKNPLKGKKSKNMDSTASKSTKKSDESLNSDDSLVSEKSKTDNYSNLGMSEVPTKVPMKGQNKSFEDNLNDFLKIQLEMRGDSADSVTDSQKSSPSEDKVESNTEVHESPQAIDSQKSSSSENKVESNTEVQEPTQTSVLVETVYSEESSAVDDVEVVKPEPTEATDDVADEIADDITEKAGPAKSAKDPTQSEQKQTEDEGTGSIEADKEGAIQKDKPSDKAIEEAKAWLGSLNGLFKKEEPPVNVIKVDKYEIDKYQAFPEATEKSETENEKSKVSEQEVDTKPIPTVESVDGGPNCPCMIGRQSEIDLVLESRKSDVEKNDKETEPQTETVDESQKQDSTESSSNDIAKESQIETTKESQPAEWSWFGFFNGAAQEEEEAKRTDIEDDFEKNDMGSSLSQAIASLMTPKVSNRFFSPMNENGEEAPSMPDHPNESNSSRRLSLLEHR